jgi:hypothetical protein
MMYDIKTPKLCQEEFTSAVTNIKRTTYEGVARLGSPAKALGFLNPQSDCQRIPYFSSPGNVNAKHANDHY